MKPASAAVLAWVGAVFEGNDLGMVWRFTDAPFRLASAQAWILSNQDLPDLLNEDRDQVAAALSEPECTHPLWETFSGSVLIRLRNDLADLGAPEFRRVIEKDEGMSAGQDLEFVALTGEEKAGFELGETVTVRLFIVRDGARIAGLGQYLLQPGWPPARKELPLPW